MAINLATGDTRWKTAFLAGFYTAGLRTTVIDRGGLAFLTDFLGHEDLSRFLPELENPDQATNWLARAFGKRSYLFFRLEVRQSRDPIGFIVFNRAFDGSLVLGGAIRRDCRGKGFASEILAGLRHFLEERNFPYAVHADVLRSNVPVIKALEKAGFKEIPVRIPGDTLRFSLMPGGKTP